MLLGLSGLLAGYKGDFEFTSGLVYPEELHFSIMRLFCATFGAGMVPLAFATSIEMGTSWSAAFLTGVMVLCGREVFSPCLFDVL